MKSLGKAWPKLEREFFSPQKKLLFLDYDGTLAPIGKTPEKVSMSERARRALTTLTHRRDYNLVVISGRSLKDIRSRFPHSKKLMFSGNHGLELSARRLKLPASARKARQHRFLMWLVVQKLQASFSHVPGIWVENKGYTLSIHYRNIPAWALPSFQELVNFYRTKYRKHPLVWTKGKKVWQIAPNVRWNKGHMARFLVRKHSGALPVVIGDDQTDEDMFRALKRIGITIRVGFSKKSCANYYVRKQKDVIKLLERLSR